MPEATRSPESLLIIQPKAPSVPYFSEPSLPAAKDVLRSLLIVNASKKGWTNEEGHIPKHQALVNSPQKLRCDVDRNPLLVKRSWSV